MNSIDLGSIVFGNIPVEPNVQFLNGCFTNTYNFLKMVGEKIELPDKLDWIYDRLNQESFIYLDEYRIQLKGNNFFIKGYTREHEPYFIEDFRNEHYLQMDCSLQVGKAHFYFAYLECDGKYNKGIARIELPSAYQSVFIARMNNAEPGPVHVKD